MNTAIGKYRDREKTTLYDVIDQNYSTSQPGRPMEFLDVRC